MVARSRRPNHWDMAGSGLQPALIVYRKRGFRYRTRRGRASHDAELPVTGGESLQRPVAISSEPVRSLASPVELERLLERLARLTPDTKRVWGTMTPHEMICHLSDSFRGVTGQRVVSVVPAHPFKRRAIRFIALRTPLPWPRGIPTMAEVDPKRQGTRPAVFESDRQALVALARRFASGEARYTSHPMFGEMSRADWLIWGYRHTDHHLRQFGL